MHQNPTKPESPPLDAEGLGKLHREYRDRLVQSIIGLVRNRDKAEDIAAQAFRKALESRESFRGEASTATWIQAIARNEVRSSARRERNIRFETVDHVEARVIPAPWLIVNELEKRDDRIQLHEALEQVPPKYRRVLTAHFVDGLSIRDIGHRERIPLGTVLSRMSKAKELLRHAWEGRLPVSRSAEREVRQASQGPRRSRYQRHESPDPSIWDR